MKELSISKELSLIEGSEKVYLTTYKDVGYELGFGRAGSYKGHSHLYFTDLLFSFNEIKSSDYLGQAIVTNLLVAPPTSYLGEVVCGDFFFVKFCPSNRDVVFPEKVDALISKKFLVSVARNEKFISDFYRKQGELGNVSVSLYSDYLHICIDGSSYRIVK